MDTIHYIAWFACVAATTVILQQVQQALRRKNRIWLFALSFVIKGFAAIAVAYVSMAICNKLVWNLGYFPAAMYASLLCDAAADLVAIIISPLRKSPKRIMLLSVILTAMVTTSLETLTYTSVPE